MIVFRGIVDYVKVFLIFCVEPSMKTFIKM